MMHFQCPSCTTQKRKPARIQNMAFSLYWIQLAACSALSAKLYGKEANAIQDPQRGIAITEVVLHADRWLSLNASRSSNIIAEYRKQARLKNKGQTVEGTKGREGRMEERKNAEQCACKASASATARSPSTIWWPQRQAASK